MKYLTPFTVIITNNLEPVYGIVLAWFILQEHEQLQAGFYVGTGIILASVGLYPLLKNYLENKTTS